eukprot:747254-Hanusia_phi.AAC.8
MKAIQEASWPWGELKRGGRDHPVEQSHESEDLEESSQVGSDVNSFVPSKRGHLEPSLHARQEPDEHVVHGEYLQSQ